MPYKIEPVFVNTYRPIIFETRKLLLLLLL